MLISLADEGNQVNPIQSRNRLATREVGDVSLMILDWGSPGGGTGTNTCIPSCNLQVSAGDYCSGNVQWSGECLWNFENPPDGTQDM